jgi:hypothetical protein
MDSSLWFKRMELIEAKRLIWAQKEKLYIIYENVESHDHRWAKTIDEGGPLMNMSSIKLELLKENDK